MQTANTQITQTSTTQVQPKATQPLIIALRKRCEADGVGLSHYILMDRKPAK